MQNQFIAWKWGGIKIFWYKKTPQCPIRSSIKDKNEQRQLFIRSFFSHFNRRSTSANRMQPIQRETIRKTRCKNSVNPLSDAGGDGWISLFCSFFFNAVTNEWMTSAEELPDEHTRAARNGTQWKRFDSTSAASSGRRRRRRIPDVAFHTTPSHPSGSRPCVSLLRIRSDSISWLDAGVECLPNYFHVCSSVTLGNSVTRGWTWFCLRVVVISKKISFIGGNDNTVTQVKCFTDLTLNHKWIWKKSRTVSLCSRAISRGKIRLINLILFTFFRFSELRFSRKN